MTKGNAWFLVASTLFLVTSLIGGKMALEKYRTPTVFPMGPTVTTIQQQPTPRQVVVYGFLPYWTVKKAQIDPSLTHLGYFSLSVDQNGNFVTTLDGNAEPGWRTFSSTTLEDLRTTTANQHQKLEVVITMMDADTIAALLSNTQAQNRFVENVKTLIQTQPIDGMNLDIEYAGEVTDKLRDAYTALVLRIATMGKKLDPTFHLSIDVFADSAEKYRIWDIAALAPSVDHIVVMAYDFFRSSSPQAGPVAPLFGSDKKRWDGDIAQYLKAFVDRVPPSKILLGVPFYGYEWRTTSLNPGSTTYPKTGALATYNRVQQLIADQHLREQWDSDAFSPFLVYTEKGRFQTIYYENSRSLSYKLDLVNQAEFAGIAIWALGYEGNTRELWQVIQQKTKSALQGN